MKPMVLGMKMKAVLASEALQKQSGRAEPLQSQQSGRSCRAVGAVENG